MSKRISKKNKMLCPEKAAEHIKKYMDNHDLNITGMGIECGLKRETISFICAGKDKAYNYDTFLQIQAKCGYFVEYWLGLTDKTTYDEYRLEIKEKEEEQEKERKKKEDAIQYENAELDAGEQLAKLHADIVRRYKDFFNLLGYRYECLDGTAAVDFSTEPRPHALTNYQDNVTHYFTEEQFKSTFDSLQANVSFACFQVETATHSTDAR